MTVAERVAEAGPRLSAAQRRVAHVVVDDPEIVAFGTVAQLAARSATSGPTVLRLAARLGFGGFGELQAAVRAEIVDALRPAAERIRERPPGDVLSRARVGDVENVRATLDAVDPADFDGAAALLADRRRRVLVLAGEIARGVGIVLVAQLDLLRDGVTSLGGSPVRVARQLADLDRDDVVVAIDHHRYERWLLDATARAIDKGAVVVALTDSALSPLAVRARHTFVVAARGVGPFDSLVGTLALAQALAADVAARLRRTATARLDAIEAAWHDGGALSDS